MDLKHVLRGQTRAGDRAVSPVISVILMVAITVILAAVIATFVLGLGEDVNESGPQASFKFTQENVTFNDTSGITNSTDVVKIIHQSGEVIDRENLEVKVNGETAWDPVGMSTGEDSKGSDGIARPAISEETLPEEVSSGDVIRIVLKNSNITEGDTIVVQGLTGQFFNKPQTGSNYAVQTLDDGDTITLTYQDPSTGQSVLIRRYTVKRDD